MFTSLAAFAAAAALVLCLVGCGGAQSTAQGNTEPVDLSVWTYYNGDQLESFNKLVDTFNDTVGKEKNITVESYSQGSVNDLEAQVMAAAQGKVGASAMPNIFMAYADTAYAMDQMGELADLAPYFTDEERAAYVDSYLTEGDFDDSGSIKIFPVAKSTELLFLNDTDWKPFAAATGAQYSDLETVEGLVKTAEAYYNWTDAQTDTPNDGKALFGRDAVANYTLIGAKELGDTIFDVKDGKMTFHVSLVSKKIVNLYPGLAADAEAHKTDWLLPTTDTVTYSDGTSEEVYGFDVPVEALDTDFQLAILGTKGKWYDHTVSVRNVEAQAAEAVETPADGSYTCEVTLEGGSGRATVDSPAALTVADGKMTATIVWSSPNYDYMIVDGEKYLPTNTEGNSTFEIPVSALGVPLSVVADTVAMSTPHEIEYTLTFSAPSEN